MIDQAADEQLLLRFGQWLREARDLAAGFAENGQPSETASPPEESFGGYRLAEEFTALRHEVKLQTKSSRALEDQALALIAPLQQAIETMRSIEPKEAQAAWTAGKSLAAALAELDESVERGRQQTAKAVARLNDEPRTGFLTRLDEFQRGRSWLARLVHGRYYRQVRWLLDVEPSSHERRALLEALLDGYRLIQKRLQQSLASEGIARVVTTGRAVDPQHMNVVEVVDVADQPGGMVESEVRPGYTWKGQLLRLAEVRATRNLVSQDVTVHEQEESQNQDRT